MKMKCIKLSLLLIGSISLANATVYQCPQPEQITLEGGQNAGKLASLPVKAPAPFDKAGQINITLLKNIKVHGDILNHGEGSFSLCCNYMPKGQEGQLESASICLASENMKAGTHDCKVRDKSFWASFDCKDQE